MMASAASLSTSTKETTNYARLCRLLVDVGCQALRDSFDGIHPPAGLHGVLVSQKPTLQTLRSKRILNATQWDSLYPTINPKSVSSANFDITLLVLLLRNICHLSPPTSTGSWDKLPPVSDGTMEANIARVKYYRNEFYGHVTKASVDDITFEDLWQKIETALIGLRADSATIKRLEHECMDPTTAKRCQEMMERWKKDDDDIKDKLNELQGIFYIFGFHQFHSGGGGGLCSSERSGSIKINDYVQREIRS